VLYIDANDVYEGKFALKGWALARTMAAVHGGFTAAGDRGAATRQIAAFTGYSSGPVRFDRRSGGVRVLSPNSVEADNVECRDGVMFAIAGDESGAASAAEHQQRPLKADPLHPNGRPTSDRILLASASSLSYRMKVITHL
jgi:hypothetical protein